MFLESRQKKHSADIQLLIWKKSLKHLTTVREKMVGVQWK